MPTKSEWVPPDLVIEHNGVKVFNAYDGNDYDDPLTYWFAIGAEGWFAPEGLEFDIRELPDPFGARACQASAEDFPEILKDAIDAGVITNENLLKELPVKERE